MDEVVTKVAALGLPGVILVITMAATGFTGAAAITAALAFLGGPAGMLGGIAVLGLTGLITEALAKVSLEDFLTAVYCQRRQTEPHGKLLEEIDSLSLFNGDMKERLKVTVSDGCGCATVVTENTTDDAKEVIAILENVPGMTRAHHRDFKSSNPIMRLRDGSVVRTWKNQFGVDHVFISDAHDRMIYGGFVGWIHSEGLNQAINRIRQDFT
ncbi:serine/threonine kinase [Calothrix brevissima NIES-22]|nr:serine/threonine kinase [Calothrix brevissima NIES-22]